MPRPEKKERVPGVIVSNYYFDGYNQGLEDERAYLQSDEFLSEKGLNKLIDDTCHDCGVGITAPIKEAISYAILQHIRGKIK